MRSGAGSGAPPRAMLGSAFCIRPAGYARRTGDAESRELQHLADGQMNSERHADPRCDLRDMSRA
jgi:hypothetical protein